MLSPTPLHAQLQSDIGAVRVPPSTVAARILALAAVVLVVFANREPQWWVNGAVRDLAGHPAYRGAWLIVEHALLSGAVSAVVAVVAWRALADRVAIPRPRALLGLPPLRTWIVWGTLSGLVPLAVNLAVMAVLVRLGKMRGLSFGFSPPDVWSVVGNFASNFYEELVFRGFLVVALRFALRNQLAAILAASAAFGLAHERYPIEEQAMIVLFSVLWCVAVVRTRSLWTSWLAHEVVDLIGDSCIKIG